MTYPGIGCCSDLPAPKLLERCLQALVSQNFPPQAYEMIIVDDGPQDPATRILVSEWQQRLLAQFCFSDPSTTAHDPGNGCKWGGKPATLSIPGKDQRSTSPQIMYLAAEGTHGPAAARNLGWRTASGRYYCLYR